MKIEDVKNIALSASSIVEFFRLIKEKNRDYNREKYQKIFIDNNINVSHWTRSFNHYHKNQHVIKGQTTNKILCKGKVRISPTILRRLMIEGGIEYKCSKCGLKDKWCNESITIQIHHINGDGTDNRLKNLQFLCPNCHSQTYNFTIRKGRKKKHLKKCPSCLVSITTYAKTCRKCKTCYKKLPNNLDIKLLAKLVWEKPTNEIAKEYGITNKVIARICKNNNINKPYRGYWNHYVYERDKGNLIKPKG